MAIRIEPGQGILGQTLHGYADGHDLLASSVTLDDASASAMLVMSDLAPARTTLREGWLVGYPLPSIEAYVIAKTWPAPEMPRPGCVWTHSLILDYATLATRRSLAPFLKLLHRPHMDFRRFELSLQGPEETGPVQITPPLYSAARGALAGLYGETGSISIGMDTEAHAEALLLAVWEQQWPRLRRRFRWSSIRVRPSPEVPAFDFIVTANDKRVDPQLDSAAPERQGWIVGALADLRAGGCEFRNELRRMAIDVSQGRRVFPLLASAAVFRLANRVRPSDGRELITAFDQRLPQGEGRSARLSVLEALIARSRSLRGKELEFAISLLPELAQGPTFDRVVAATWAQEPERFWSSIWPIVPEAAKKLLANASIAELREALQVPGADLDFLLSERPDLSADIHIWRRNRGIIGQLRSTLYERPELLRKAVECAFQEQDLEVAEELVADHGTTVLFDVYSQWERKKGSPSRARDGFERAWLKLASRDQKATRDYLESDFRLRPTIVALARQLGPQSFKAGRNEPDLWLHSWESCAGSPVRADSEYIAAFFLVRACTQAAREQEEMFATFAQLAIGDTGRGPTDDEAWQLLSDTFVLPLAYHFLGSRYRSLIQGIAARTMKKGVPVGRFLARGRIEFVEDLVGELRHDRRGREMIEDCLQREKLPKSRKQLLERALAKWF